MTAVRGGHVDAVRSLLDKPGMDIDTKPADGVTALKIACLKGNLEVAKLLVAAGAKVDPQASDDWGPLVSAASRGHLQVVKYLVEEAGADVRCGGFDGGVTALMQAADRGHVDVVEYLLGRQDIDIDAKRADGRTAFGLACLNGHLEVAKLLVAAGARVNPQSRDEAGALLSAASGGHLQVVKYLVEEAGADVRCAGFGGGTVPTHSAGGGYIDVVDYLQYVKRGVGRTALDYACVKGHLEVAKLLVAAGARVNPQHSKKGGPLMYAAMGGQLHVFKYLVEEAGADVRCGGFDGMTVLMYAADGGHLGVVEYLRGRQDIDIDAKSDQGTTALDLACRKGHLEVAKLLVAAGARVNPQHSNKGGALLSAAWGGHLHVVKYLVEEAGADVRCTTSRGKTALMFAADKGHADVAEYLRRVTSQREYEVSVAPLLPAHVYSRLMSSCAL
jgi:ankyrin repeat protein